MDALRHFTNEEDTNACHIWHLTEAFVLWLDVFGEIGAGIACGVVEMLTEADNKQPKADSPEREGHFCWEKSEWEWRLLIRPMLYKATLS